MHSAPRLVHKMKLDNIPLKRQHSASSSKCETEKVPALEGRYSKYYLKKK